MTPRRRVPGDVLIHLRRARDHLDHHYADEFDLDLVAGLAAARRALGEQPEPGPPCSTSAGIPAGLPQHSQ